MDSISAIGSVERGKGVGRSFTTTKWFRSQIEKKFKFTPHAGTLNIRFQNGESEALTKLLSVADMVEIVPPKGHLKAKCFSIMIMDKIRGVVVIPEKPERSANVLEILAPMNLRDELSLKDGDELSVKVIPNDEKPFKPDVF